MHFAVKFDVNTYAIRRTAYSSVISFHFFFVWAIDVVCRQCACVLRYSLNLSSYLKFNVSP